MRSILRPLKLLVAALALVAVALALPRPALALGTVNLNPRDPTEADGRWKLNMTVDYGSIPPIPHIPVIFSFTATALYERQLNDKSPDKPVVVRLPLQNQQAINESMDIGFSDATGKVFKVTKFDFVIKRDHGFEAGEYDLKIKREDDGAQIGQVIHIILKGDNPVVDRRAIVFSGEGKVRKVADDRPKDDKPADDDKKAAPEAKDDSKGDDAKKEDTDAPGPPAVPPKQGGCGCVVAGDEAPGAAGMMALAALGAAVALRRKRARASTLGA